MKHSILDAVHIPLGGTSRDALNASIALARDAEEWGCERFWIVEHHDVSHEATPSPEVFIGILAGATNTISVGSGGVILNHYSPYKVAENFMTLEAMFPGRIDLGIGRNTAGPAADMALQRYRQTRERDDHRTMLTELTAWLSHQIDDTGQFNGLRIMGDLPAGPTPWVLSASHETTAIATEVGLHLVASGFHRPDLCQEMLATYARDFRPSHFAAGLQKPHGILAVRVFAGETHEEGERLAMPIRATFSMRKDRKDLTHMPTVDEAIAHMGGLVAAEPGVWERLLVGSYDGVMEKITAMVEATGVAEIMVQVFSPDLPTRRQCHHEIAKRLALL